MVVAVVALLHSIQFTIGSIVCGAGSDKLANTSYTHLLSRWCSGCVCGDLVAGCCLVVGGGGCVCSDLVAGCCVAVVVGTGRFCGGLYSS